MRTVFPIGIAVFVAIQVMRFWRDSRSAPQSPALLFPFAVWIALLVFVTWNGHRLSSVWLVGDTLEVTGPASLRVPLSQVRSLRAALLDYRGTPLFILSLDPPIGNTEKIRFIPRSDSWHSSKARVVQKTLRTRIDAARAARRLHGPT
ncbi:MAG TPA: hypothetical protein VNW46_06935 [Gemmatimonadaceae bacterium]|nr:hypothetical protein [Gemmatimonadaceae bacterium]